MSLSWPIFWLDEIDSTNEEAKRRASKAGFSPQWITAHRQTSGRGRLGREWVSPQGNLYTTALFRWHGEQRDMTRIPFAAALAVADSVDALTPNASPKLKWPNDVRCDGAKVSGILVEAGELDGVRWIATGIGINIVSSPVGIGQDVTSVAELREDKLIDASVTLETLRQAFAARLKEAQTDFSQTREAWLSRAEGLGERVRVNVNGEPHEGVFKDMGPDGALILQLHDGSLTPIRAGDVELIKEVDS